MGMVSCWAECGYQELDGAGRSIVQIEADWRMLLRCCFCCFEYTDSNVRFISRQSPVIKTHPSTMGKRGKAARKRRRENEVVSTFASITTAECNPHVSANEGMDAAPESSSGLHGISDAALSVTVATLNSLSGLVDATTGKLAIKDKRYRSLRKFLYEFQNSTGIHHASDLSPSCSGINNGVSSLVGTEKDGVPPAPLISSSKITREISSHIENDAWELAVVTLRNIRKRQQANAVQGDGNGKNNSQSYLRPKLGAMQRWVRQLDAAGTDNPLALEVLDAILRFVSPESIIPVDKFELEKTTWATLGVNDAMTGEDKKYNKRGRIRLFPPFDRRPKDLELYSLNDDRVGQEDTIDALVSCMVVGDDGIRRIASHETRSQHQPLFRQCGFERGEDRKPPNYHDLVIMTTAAVAEAQATESNQSGGRLLDTLSGQNMLLDNNNSRPVVKSLLPYIRGSFLLENVLSPTECNRLIASAEKAGFHPDEPIGDQPGASILAHACVWIVDYILERTIFERVKPFLPSYEQSSQDHCSGDVMETCQPLQLNRRFRFYRYVPGRYYRPHIDGAWPPSGFDRDGNYRYDISDHTNKNGLRHLASEEDRKAHQMSASPDQPRLEPNRRRQLSRLTFLIYLNDDFDGGHTTFFVPAAEKEGILNAFPVTPVRGGILVFPHGTCAAPLHEGSPVLSGAKYVVRTEVEYYV